jgi:hypothetical protein
MTLAADMKAKFVPWLSAIQVSSRKRSRGERYRGRASTSTRTAEFVSVCRDCANRMVRSAVETRPTQCLDLASGTTDFRSAEIKC